jgi:hypothetical protein
MNQSARFGCVPYDCRGIAVAFSMVALCFGPTRITSAEGDGIAAARYRSAGQAVRAQADGAIVCEAEEFSVDAPGWQALPWGQNYYAATFANTFLSRKAFLGAPEAGPRTVATIEVDVPAAGRYLALARYEAAYRFETQFRLTVEQGGRTLLDRVYGARANPKVWAFREGLKPEVAWPWGAVENVVWEGTDAAVDLAAGRATITLIAEEQPAPAAKRNVDLVLLTPDAAGVEQRLKEESYLPLDGLLTQSGDVYLKLHNAGAAAMTLEVPPCTQHSPYWVHQRDWQAVKLSAEPGAATDWVEVGGLLDTLNDGQWTLTAQPAAGLNYKVEFGVRDAAGTIASIATFDSQAATLPLAFDADTRYTRRIRRDVDVLYDLVDYLKAHPVPGSPPTRTPIFAYTFDPRPDDPRYTAALAQFKAMYSLTSTNADVAAAGGPPRGYIDVRGQTPEQLEATCQKLRAEGKADGIAVVSLGDEIGLAAPADADAGFRAWLQAQGLKPADIDPAAGDDWNRVTYSVAPEGATGNPGQFYHSRRYQHHYGIEAQKALTDVLRRHLPNAGIGANFSPHHHHAYLGATHQWVTLFRRDGMTMPWGEDYIWQIPLGSQQMNFINLDLFRAGLRGKPAGRIHYYVMPHTPGNTPASWRRQFYGDLGHGMKLVNLFEFRPVQAAYTENHTSFPEMFLEVRRSFNELGGFEDIIQDGQVRQGVAGLWFSETSDIWDDNQAPFAAGKRTLYVAIRHTQLPLDVVIEEDALAGDLKDYRVLYLADRHVSRAASKAIADWVAAGGSLFCTAGAGLWDEFNQSNATLRELLGVEPAALETPEPTVHLEKQDLPFVDPIDTVTLSAGSGDSGTIPVIAARCRVAPRDAEVLGTFADGSAAVTRRQVGTGQATWCGFLPGLSYFHPAIPRRPVDRGSSDDAMSHFIPTEFNRAAGDLIAQATGDAPRPVICSQPLVETTVVEAPHGICIPLVNWSAGPMAGLTVEVDTAALNPAGAGNSITLASGKPVQADTRDGRLVLTLDLDVADAIILRP